MQRIVAAVLLIILALAAAIATTQLMNREWTNATRTYSVDASDSYVTMDSAGNATFQIVLRNTGTVTANIQNIIIADQQIEITFASVQVQLHFWGLGKMFTGNVSFSNPNEAKVSDWLVLPPGQSAYMTFQATNVGSVMTVGGTYVATIYPSNGSGGEVLTFRLVVQSAPEESWSFEENQTWGSGIVIGLLIGLSA